MHCEIIDRQFNIFLVEIQLIKENLKVFLGARIWAPKEVYQSPESPEYPTALCINQFLPMKVFYFFPDFFSYQLDLSVFWAFNSIFCVTFHLLFWVSHFNNFLDSVNVGYHKTKAYGITWVTQVTNNIS